MNLNLLPILTFPISHNYPFRFLDYNPSSTYSNHTCQPKPIPTYSLQPRCNFLPTLNPGSKTGGYLWTQNLRMRKSGTKYVGCKLGLGELKLAHHFQLQNQRIGLRRKTQMQTWEWADAWVAGTVGQCGAIELRSLAPNCRRCAAYPNSWMHHRHSHHGNPTILVTSRRSRRSVDCDSWAGQLPPPQKKPVGAGLVSFITCQKEAIRVEVPVTNHLRDSAPHLEKYKVMQIFPMLEDRNRGDCNFFGDFIPWIEINVNFCN